MAHQGQAAAGNKPLRLFFHAPGIAAHRPQASMPLITGAQSTTTDTIAGLYPNHTLTGNRGNIIHAEAPAKIFAKSPGGSTYGNLAEIMATIGDGFALRMSRSFDLVIISMANFIRPDHDGRRLLTSLKALEDRVPVVVLGCGLQGNHKLSDMMPGNTALIDWFNQNAVIFGVRGAKTANWLYDNGFKNADVLGCPSLYAYPHSIMGLDGSAARGKGAEADVMTAGYVKIANGTLAPRGVELAHAFHKIRSSYVFQDEPWTFADLAQIPGLYNEGSNEFRADLLNDWLGQQAGGKLRFQRYYYFNEAGAWRQAALRHDVYVGDRFHGGVAALQAGVPAIFLSHDNRVAELTEHFGLPHLTTKAFARKGLAAVLEEYLSPQAMQSMKTLYQQRRREFFVVAARAGLTPTVHEVAVPDAVPAAPPVPFRQKLRRLSRRFR